MSTADQLFPSEDELEQLRNAGKRPKPKSTADQLLPSEDEITSRKRTKPVLVSGGASSGSGRGSGERAAPPAKKNRSMPRLSPIPAPHKATARELFGTDSEDDEDDRATTSTSVLRPSPTANIDAIQKIIGSFGKYHLWLCLLIFLSKIPVAFHQMAIIFLAPRQPYICPDTMTETCPCPNPEYNTTVFNSTIISEWNLICSQKWLTSFTQTVFQLGTLIGSIVFGTLSDRFGRKFPMLAAVVLQVTSGVAAAYMPEYWSFTMTRFVVGITVGGTMVVGFVIVMEFVGSEHRDIISAFYQVPFNLGHLLLAICGYFVRDYSKFQLVISVPTVVLLSYIFLIPETPRWLIAVKRTDEAITVLERVAKVNKRPTENIRAEIEAFQKAKEKSHLGKGTLLDLFRTPNLRKNILAMAFNWLACSYCFYGVSQYVGQLSGNMFINVASSAVVAMLGTLLSIPLMKLVGRRTLVIVFNFVCSGCLLLLIVVPEGTGSVVCACIGVVSSFIVFVTVYLYCSELFPTVVRNAALGFSSMLARVGSMIAPFVIGTQDRARWLPPLIFAIVPLIAGFVTLLLPETKGCELMTTIEEGEQFGKKQQTRGSPERNVTLNGKKPADNTQGHYNNGYHIDPS